MGRLSKVDRLPEEVRAAIAALRRDGRTIDEILAHLRGMGVPPAAVGRSGLGEHVKELDEIAKLARQDRAMAQVLVRKEFDEGDSDLIKANIEMMHGIVFRMNMASRRDENFTGDPKEMKLLSEVMRNLASAAKIDLEKVEKAETRAAARAKREAAEAAATTLRQHGITMETVEAVKSRILGVPVVGSAG